MAVTNPNYAAKLQPRFAAYLLSRGLPISPDADLLAGWQADFLAWIPRAKQWAVKNGSGVGMRSNGETFITDHEAFTASCFAFANVCWKEA